jgi:DNA replication protein DnaC
MVAKAEKPMDGLGNVYERIQARCRTIPSNTETLSPATQCPICKGYGWLSTKVPIHDPRFGQLLRCECQGESDRTKLCISANLPHEGYNKTFENFLMREGVRPMFSAAEAFCTDEAPPFLVMVGKFGCGKSHLIEAIGRRMIEAGSRVRYDVASSLLDQMRHTYADTSQQTLQELMDWYADKDVLLLDDIGYEKPTPFGIDKLTTLIDERLRNRKKTAIATNQVRDELEETLGGRLVDRLFATNERLHEVVAVVCRAESYRRNQVKV